MRGRPNRLASEENNQIMPRPSISTNEDQEEDDQDKTKQYSLEKRKTDAKKVLTHTTRSREKVQIFLGGSCNPTTWRQTVAIPFLESNGISYYNPQIDEWTPEVANIESRVKKNADWLLFVIDKQTRSTASLVESAFLAGSGKRLVLVIYPFDFSIDHLSIQSDTKKTSNVIETQEQTTTTSTTLGDCSVRSSSSSKSTTSSSSFTESSSNFASGIIKVNGESLSFAEFQELRQARFILQRLLSNQGVPVFSDIHHALRLVTNSMLIRNPSSPIAEIVPKLRDQFEKSRGDFVSHSRQDDKSIQMKQAAKKVDAIPTNDENDSLDHDTTKDVYLSLDDNGDSEATIIPILKEKGLSYTYRRVSDLTNLDPLGTTSTISKPKNEISLTMSETGMNKCPSNSECTTLQESALNLERIFSDMRKSRVILIVVSKKCRGLSIMVLASHFMSLFRQNVVLCIQYLEEPCFIDGETLTKSAIADYNRGRMYLGACAAESEVPVFGNIREAVDCCSEKCRHGAGIT